MDKAAITLQIKTAFTGVTLEDGIGLWEAQAIDDYAGDSTRKKYRLKDEAHDWQRIDSNDLQRCYSSLCFFDASAMKFHIPAFIIASLTDDVDEPIFHLTQRDDYSKSKFSTLSQTQIIAVKNYLIWCLKQNEYETDHLAIRYALNEFWPST